MVFLLVLFYVSIPTIISKARQEIKHSTNFHSHCWCFTFLQDTRWLLLCFCKCLNTHPGCFFKYFFWKILADEHQSIIRKKTHVETKSFSKYFGYQALNIKCLLRKSWCSPKLYKNISDSGRCEHCLGSVAGNVHRELRQHK